MIEYVWCVSHSRARAIRIHKQSKLKREKETRINIRFKKKRSISYFRINIYMTLPAASEKSRISEGIYSKLFSFILILFILQLLVPRRMNT
jgi:hypothetical protein